MSSKRTRSSSTTTVTPAKRSRTTTASKSTSKSTSIKTEKHEPTVKIESSDKKTNKKIKQESKSNTASSSPSTTQSLSIQIKSETPNPFAHYRKHRYTRNDMLRMLTERESMEYKRGTTITVNDKMQEGYQYTLVENPGENFAEGFNPVFTPAEMLRLGIFEGHYYNDGIYELPKEWFLNEDGSLLKTLSPERSNEYLNLFEIKSRLNLSEWQKNKWIPCTFTRTGIALCKNEKINPGDIFDPDIRGWFQWYCRYYLGRRIDILDRIQIQRWKAFKRHRAQVEHSVAPHDLSTRKKQRQGLLQWSYKYD